MMIKKFIVILFFLVFACGCSCKKPNKDSLSEVNPNNKVYYQIFVRSFADSDSDGVGDFNGITAKLDHLKEFGVEGIWLMPIMETSTYHGYDVKDYYNVNSEYGTMSDFENLVKEARKRNIDVMMDMVFNHTSNENEWFLKALAGEEKYINYYNMIPKTNNTSGMLGIDGQNIWHTMGDYKYSGVFSNTMPDLNLANEEVIEEIYKISDFWVEKGVRGFRLDACKYLFSLNENFHKPQSSMVDNIIFLNNLREHLRSKDDKFYLIGEVYETNIEFIDDYFTCLDSPLDFPISDWLMSKANNSANYNYVSRLTDYYDKYRTINTEFVSAPFLTNHDMDRVASKLSGNTDKIKLAAEMLLTLPGTPIIYYGEELGMFGIKSNGPEYYDETRRTPFKWGDEYDTTWFNNDANVTVNTLSEQETKVDSVYNTYKKIIEVRNNNIALKYGNEFSAYENNETRLQGYYRSYSYENQSQKVLVIHNFDEVEVDIPSVEYKNILYISGYDSFSGVNKIPAKGTIIFEIGN